MDRDWLPTTQSSSQSPNVPGTGILKAETERGKQPICRVSVSRDHAIPRIRRTCLYYCHIASVYLNTQLQRVGGGDSMDRDWLPTTQSSNQSPSVPGTGIFKAETER
jgi:hypothetical protein